MSVQEQTLPTGVTLYTDERYTYVKVDGRHIVTEATGKRKSFRGIDEAAQIRAKKWIHQYRAGNYREDYRLERDGEQVW